MKKFVITGASGKTGKKVAELLLRDKQNVTVITRNAENVKNLQALGAHTAIGNTNDTDFLKKTFDGANAVFVLIPVDATSQDHKKAQEAHVNAITDALAVSSVSHVVGLSSYGIHLPSQWGIIYGLKKMEEKFGELTKLNTMFLRASYFMENSLGLIGGIKKFGAMAAPLRPDITFPVVATDDIAQRAAKHLMEETFQGKNSEDLLGTRFVSYPEIASTYGSAIGIPDLKYKQVSYEDFKNAAVNLLGMSPNVADHYIEFMQNMNNDAIYKGPKVASPDLTKTSIEDFAKIFAAVFNASK